MAFEMLLGNYLNPFFGSSIVTWGAIIGTVLLALSVGYALGGRLADAFPSGELIGLLLCGASAYLFVLPFASNAILLTITDSLDDARAGALVASLIFSMPLISLGMYLPFAVRISSSYTTKIGKVTGNLYAISTLGSILGTLSVSFYLVVYVGTRDLNVALSLIAGVVGIANVVLLKSE